MTPTAEARAAALVTIGGNDPSLDLYFVTMHIDGVEIDSASPEVAARWVADMRAVFVREYNAAYAAGMEAAAAIADECGRSHSPSLIKRDRGTCRWVADAIRAAVESRR